MTISDTQKVDVLWKKIGFGVSKSDTSTAKSGSNETIASPTTVYAQNIWSQASLIPSTPPSSTTTAVAVRTGGAGITCVADTTSASGRSWRTNVIDWIPDTFAATPGAYAVRVWLGSVGGTRLFADGSGNNDEYFFDPVSGLLNFIGTNLPTGVTGASTIIVEGYSYRGNKGLVGAGGGSQTIFFSDIAGRNASSTVVAGDLGVVANNGDGEYAIYVANASGPTSNWTLISTQDSADTDAKTLTKVINTSSSVTELLGNISGQRRVISVVVEVVTEFNDNSATITVGDAVVTNRLMSVDNNDLSIAGVYISTPTYVYPQSTSDLNLNVTFNKGSSTVGSAIVTITFA